MPVQYFKSSYKKTSLVMTSEELLEIYFFGTPPESIDGKSMTQSSIETYIMKAQQELEKYLEIKIKRQIIEESQDFMSEDFLNWSYLRQTFLVVEPILLEGYINDVRQITYPKEWLSCKLSSDETMLTRDIYLVPGNNVPRTNSVVYSGIIPHIGFMGVRQIPHYWRARYLTGFEKIPMELVDFIGKLASIPIFMILGDLILGAGIANQSISIDNLSQSIGTTSSATNSGYGARIVEIRKDLVEKRKDLKDQYRGYRFTVG